MSKPLLKFKIITPEKAVLEEQVEQATLMTGSGQITILPNHRTYIASLIPGEAMIKKDGKETYLSISGGFIEFNANVLTVLADTAERADEIDLVRAQEARKKAEELKNQAISMNEEEYARVAVAIQKESARINVAKKHHTRGGFKME
jgi:F-type H+-transporting ATPase subunit epsilon